MPWLASVAVFYWALFRPNKFHFGEALAIGLLQDVLVGTPLGFHASALIILYWLAQTQIHGLSERSFLMVWVSFGFMLAASLLWLSVVMWVIGIPFTVWVAAVWLTTVMVFPLVYVALAWSHSKLTLGA